MFDRKAIRQHHEALNAIMKKYCEEHGLVFVPKSLSYTNTSFDYKFEAKEAGEEGYPELSELERMIILGHMDKAPEETKNCKTPLGRSVYTISGRVIKLVGFNRKKQYCWVIEVDGKQKICKNEMIDWSRGFAA